MIKRSTITYLLNNSGILTLLLKRILPLFFPILLCTSSNANVYDSLYTRSIQNQFTNPDSALSNLILCLPYYKKKQDTTKIINIKIQLIKLYSGNGNYYKAYDETWSILPLINTSKYIEPRIEVNLQLSSLYIIFEQYERAHKHLEEALKLTNSLNRLQNKSVWRSKLYSRKAWLITNETSDFEAAQKLLFMAINENTNEATEWGRIYIQMQLAELYILNDSISQAHKILRRVEQICENQYTHAYSLLFDHFGQLHMKKSAFDSAIYYFQKSLLAIDTYKNHKDNKVEILDSLASCYHYLGEYEMAFQYAKKSSAVSNSLFGSRSIINKQLFEIRNSYEDQLKIQQLEILEHEQKVLLLKTIIYISILALIILALVIRTKIKAKKIRLLARQKKYELEVKNKELVSAALQLIERDTLLNDIWKSLSSMNFQVENQNAIHKILSLIRANKTKKWKEFELYFTGVNEDFYRILRTMHPDLSSTDVKMCALIKLGLSSKDMAEIMAIAPDSVNTSRSRIRKKMKLSREVKLLDYLNRIN